MQCHSLWMPAVFTINHQCLPSINPVCLALDIGTHTQLRCKEKYLLVPYLKKICWNIDRIVAASARGCFSQVGSGEVPRWAPTCFAFLKNPRTHQQYLRTTHHSFKSCGKWWNCILSSSEWSDAAGDADAGGVLNDLGHALPTSCHPRSNLAQTTRYCAHVQTMKPRQVRKTTHQYWCSGELKWRTEGTLSQAELREWCRLLSPSVLCSTLATTSCPATLVLFYRSHNIH